eukprot:scaffold9657_cov103-Isochrysis_galbana.AAC.5
MFRYDYSLAVTAGHAKASLGHADKHSSPRQSNLKQTDARGPPRGPGGAVLRAEDAPVEQIMARVQRLDQWGRTSRMGHPARGSSTGECQRRLRHLGLHPDRGQRPDQVQPHSSGEHIAGGGVGDGLGGSLWREPQHCAQGAERRGSVRPAVGEERRAHPPVGGRPPQPCAAHAHQRSALLDRRTVAGLIAGQLSVELRVERSPCSQLARRLSHGDPGCAAARHAPTNHAAARRTAAIPDSTTRNTAHAAAAYGASIPLAPAAAAAVNRRRSSSSSAPSIPSCTAASNPAECAKPPVGSVASQSWIKRTRCAGVRAGPPGAGSDTSTGSRAREGKVRGSDTDATGKADAPRALCRSPSRGADTVTSLSLPSPAGSAVAKRAPTTSSARGAAADLTA